MEQLAAVIVEDREFIDFGEICHNHLKYLPTNTKLFVFTSNNLLNEYKSQLSKFGYTDSVIFKLYEQVSIPKIFYKINGFTEILKTNEKINFLLNFCLFQTSESFWKTFSNFYRVLTFHTDSGILRSGVEEFYEWDYIGAPCYSYVNDKTIMNGALSLRNPRIMEYICRYHKWDTDLDDLINLGNYSTASFFAEDIFFSLRMIKYNIGKYPPLEVSKLFSVESKFNWGSFGYHAPDRYLTTEELMQLKTQYTKKDLEN